MSRTRTSPGHPTALRLRALLLLALVALSSGACHTYRAIPDRRAPAAGTPVVLHLTDSGAVALAHEIGPAVESIEGNVVHADSTLVTISVRRVRMRGGLSNDWAGERVTVARAVIAAVSEKRLSRIRSLAFASGMLAGAALAATGVTGIVGGGGGGRGGPGGER